MEVSIIGAGRTGRALGLLARRAGYRIGPVICRTRPHAREAVRFIGAGRPGTEPVGAELTLVAVPDAEIPRLARRLRLPPGTVAAHTCASLGAGALRPHEPAGAFHPLRSFADPAGAVASFAGTACAIDGDPAAVRRLEAFARAIGGRPFRVRSDRKALYHAGAVVASNYLVTLLEAAVRILGAAGVSRSAATDALLQLAAGTLENVSACGLPDALTGPLERGDVDTVRRQARALGAAVPRLSELYAVLGALTIEVARAKGSLGAGRAAALRSALRSPRGSRPGRRGEAPR